MTWRPEAARVLHVAALPFPSHQGTQAALASMLEASTSAGRDAQLLTYGRHDGLSLRSGPSLQKLRLDGHLLVQLHSQRARLAPEVIIAHHVEAAAITLSLRAPWVFFAHTDLRQELPTYAHRLAAPLLSTAGGALDACLLRLAPAVAVISPALHASFVRNDPGLAEKSAYVPTPWRVPSESTRGERERSRQRLGLALEDTVLLYAGNLDAYQGLDTLLRAVAHVFARRTRGVLLVATESDASALRAAAGRMGIGACLRVTALRGEEARRRVHAAADVAVVPRLAPGGLPIKLLDALARGLPCAVAPRACAGLPLSNVASVAPDDSADALARAITDALSSTHTLGLRGPTYIRHAHTPERYFQALDNLLAAAPRTYRQDGERPRTPGAVPRR